MRTLTLLLALAVAAAAEPRATTVVVRGRRTLTDATLAAVRPLAARRSRPAPLAIVVDVTPYTAAAESALRSTLRELDGRLASVRDWRIGRLGGELHAAVTRPGALAPFLPLVFRRPSDVPSTIPALRLTLRDFNEAGGMVLYLADWHFEDDEGLEGLVEDLRARHQSLSVVGSEAAFGRGWNDGFFPPDRCREKLYDATIGRNAFTTERFHVPWHGGDTAYNHLPFRYRGTHWSTVFPVEQRRPKQWEDLRERLRDEDDEALERYWFPLPSGFGPYGLMRAAGETAGKYVLWSWNPDGRSDVRYDFARTDLFAPDLRARAEIQRDVWRQPAARALVDAWNLVASRTIQIAAVTAPFDGRGARAMEESRGDGFLAFSWRDRAAWKQFLRNAEASLEALDAAVARLDRGIAAQESPARRLLADTHLFRHTLAVQRFQLGEALAAARRAPRNAWKRPGLLPGLDPETWLRAESIDGADDDVALADAKAGATLVDERRAFLERYAGTPFGELVRRNGVQTYRLVWRETGEGRRVREAPAQSDGDRRGPVTGGGSTGGGTTTR